MPSKNGCPERRTTSILPDATWLLYCKVSDINSFLKCLRVLGGYGVTFRGLHFGECYSYIPQLWRFIMSLAASLCNYPEYRSPLRDVTVIAAAYVDFVKYGPFFHVVYLSAYISEGNSPHSSI